MIYTKKIISTLFGMIGLGPFYKIYVPLKKQYVHDNKTYHIG